MAVKDAQKRIEDRAKKIWRDLLNQGVGAEGEQGQLDAQGFTQPPSSDELWAIAYDIAKKENPSDAQQVDMLGAGIEEANKFSDFVNKIKDDGGDTKGFVVKEDEDLLQNIYYEKDGEIVKGKSATADILSESRRQKNLPTQGYAGETYTFTNNLTGKVETHSFDGNKWNPVMVDGKQVNLNSLALFDDKGKNLAMKQGYTGKMASPFLYGGGEASKEYDPATFTENKGKPKSEWNMGAGGQGGGTPTSDQGGGAPPPSGGGMGSPPPTAGAGTPPFTGGTDPTKFRDPNINPYLTEQDNIRYDDSWRNIAMANGTQFNTLTQPYGAGNAAMMSLPDAFYNAFTPAQYGGLLSTANVGGIAPIFRSPFYDYMNRAGLSYGLGDPTRAAIQGSRGFADYLGTQQAPMSTADIWGNVANLMSPQGLQGYDENTQQFLRSQYGIGQGGDVKPRTELAFNLLSQDINPLWRQGYTDLLQREFARAQLSNPIYTSQPLSWALNRRLGMTPTLNEAGWAQALTPQFDSSGNVMGGGPMGGQGY